MRLVSNQLSIPVLPFVVFQILTRPDIGDPVGMFAVPEDGLAEPLVESHRGTPTDFFFHLGAVDGVAPIVARAVFDVADQRAWLAYRIQQRVRKLEIGSLATATDIVHFPDTSTSPNLI